MVLTHEYRVCMPLSVDEYKIGQLYMVARHSLEQTGSGSGVEIIDNHECEDPKNGKGRFTEKRIHLNNRLPYWMQAIVPKVFYVTEKAWNYYPNTITEYTALNLTEKELSERTVDYIDIVYDEISPKHYKEEEDLRFFQSNKTGRGPLAENWQTKETPIMCSYKIVHASFEVWGLQTRAELLIQQSIREILLLGHKQAFAWIDEWHGMSIEQVREYEARVNAEINSKIRANLPSSPTAVASSSPLSVPTPAASSWFSWS